MHNELQIYILPFKFQFQKIVPTFSVLQICCIVWNSKEEFRVEFRFADLHLAEIIPRNYLYKYLLLCFTLLLIVNSDTCKQTITLHHSSTVKLQIEFLKFIGPKQLKKQGGIEF